MEQKKLYRSTKDKKICGVFGGLAEYIDIDVTLLRIVGVVCCFCTGILPVTILYIICAAIMPKDNA